MAVVLEAEEEEALRWDLKKRAVTANSKQTPMTGRRRRDTRGRRRWT